MCQASGPPWRQRARAVAHDIRTHGLTCWVRWSRVVAFSRMASWLLQRSAEAHQLAIRGNVNTRRSTSSQPVSVSNKYRVTGLTCWLGWSRVVAFPRMTSWFACKAHQLVIQGNINTRRSASSQPVRSMLLTARRPSESSRRRLLLDPVGDGCRELVMESGVLATVAKAYSP